MAAVSDKAPGSPSEAANWPRRAIRPVPHRTFSVNPGVRGRGGGAARSRGGEAGRGGAAGAGGWLLRARKIRRRSRRAPARPRARRSPPPPLSAAAAAGQPRLAPRSLPLPRRSHCPPASGGGEWRHGSEVAGPLAFVIHKARRRLGAAGPGVGLGLLEDAGPGEQGAIGREPSVSIPLLGAHTGLVPLVKYITSHQALSRR